MFAQRARDNLALHRVLRARRGPGRAHLRRALLCHRPHRAHDRTGAAVPGGSCSSATSTSKPPSAARLRDAGHRPAARTAARRVRRDRRGGRDRRRAPPGAGRPRVSRSRCSRARPRSTVRSCSACATTCEERLHARRAWPLRGHRLRPRRVPGRGRAGPGAGEHGDHALAVLLAWHPERRAGPSPRRSASGRTSCPSAQ